MMVFILHNLPRIIVPLLVSAMLISCSASQHAGKLHKKRPPMNETNENVWYEYWQDQFDARKGKVIPPSSKFPEVARNAFILAHEDRKEKEQTASLNTIFTVMGSILAVAILISLLNYSAATNASSQNL